MTDKGKIRNIIELFIAWNGETEAIDIANLDSAVDFIADSLQEEPVSDDLEKAVRGILKNIEPDAYHTINQGSLNEREEPAWSEELVLTAIKAGAQWQKQQMMKKQ